MAVTIVATAGSASANSYATLAEANSYFEGRPGADAWTDATTPERNQALVGATVRLEQESYWGTRVDSTQALSWPRSGLYHDGIEVSEATVPEFVKRAQFEEALALLDDPERYAATGLEGFDALKAGSIALDLRHGAAGAHALAPATVRLLGDVRKPGIGSGQMDVIRG